MNYNEISFTLIRSKEDARLESEEYQKELIEFCEQLPKELAVRKTMFAMDSTCGGGGLYGEFILTLGPGVIHIIRVVIHGWLNRHSGRRVRMECGDKKIEAHIEDLPAVMEAFEKFEKSHENLNRNYN